MHFSEVLCGAGNHADPTESHHQTSGDGGACAPGLANGQVDQRNYHGDWHNVYVCDGSPTAAVWEPHYTYVGHRFVELRGYPGTPTTATLQQRVVHSDVEAAPGPSSADPEVTPRRLAGSIAFGGSSAAAAPSIDGPVRCPCLRPWTPALLVSCLLTAVPVLRPGEHRAATRARPASRCGRRRPRRRYSTRSRTT
eukprot:SAG22_NODE_2140_length_2952_cov_2.317210_3_plen_195_part_00